LILSFWTFKTI